MIILGNISLYYLLLFKINININAPPLIKLFLPLSLYSPFFSWNSQSSVSSSFLWIWSNWVWREVNFVSQQMVWWCKREASPDILVLMSWTDAIMLSKFSLYKDKLEWEPWWDAEVSVLIPFWLWPMLVLSVQMLIGLG